MTPQVIAAEIAARIPTLAEDCAVNREAVILGLLHGFEYRPSHIGRVDVHINFLHTIKGDAHYDWPEDCYLQAGPDGAVSDLIKGSYTTAFFEAFPKTPDTYLRGEGSTIIDAEAVCWAKYQRIIHCRGHEMERRDRDDGYATCKRCNLFARVLDPILPCVKCGVTSYKVYSRDTENKPICEPCHKKWKKKSYG